MQFQYRVNSGMFTVDAALGVLSVVIVFFIVLGMFYDNVDKMANNSNIKKIVGTNNAKTYYKSYGREYQKSTIYVK